MNEYADEKPDDDVDCRDDEAGNRIALHKLGGAVHRAEEAALRFDLGPPLLSLGLVDKTG